MSALTLTSKPVLDGTGATVTTQLYVDPNHSNANGPVVAVVMGDGTILTLGQALAAASVPVVLTAAQLTSLTAPVVSGSVALTSASYTSQITITRPANQTPYTANDVVGGALTFATIGASATGVIITGADLLPEIASIPSGMTSFRLYLYSATPPSAIADNSPWTFTSSDWAIYLGYVDLGSPVDLGAALFVQIDNINKKVLLGASTSLFGYLVTNGGFTPAANSEVYLLRLQTLGA